MTPAPGNPSWFSERSDGVRLAVKVTPRAAREAIGAIELDARGDAWLTVRVTAPPEAGKANADVVRLLARRLGVPGRDLCVVAGASGRRKLLYLQGIGEPLIAKLRSLA